NSLGYMRIGVSLASAGAGRAGSVLGGCWKTGSSFAVLSWVRTVSRLFVLMRRSARGQVGWGATARKFPVEPGPARWGQHRGGRSTVLKGLGAARVRSYRGRIGPWGRVA